MDAARSITPPRSWTDPVSHHLKALESPWYRALVFLQDSMLRSTVAFWRERGAVCAQLPITTGSVSSPMGLGSDSSPVAVDMFGVRTYLADSMQFGLEYLCRLSGTDTYYFMPAFRGENPDDTHLCQFYHSEVEIRGGLDDVAEVAEAYVRRLVTDLLADHEDLLSRLTGSRFGHVHRLLDRREPFGRMTFAEAVTDLGGDERYVREVPDGGWRTLTRAGEQELLGRHGEFLWVTHWDRLAVPFYQATDENTGCALNGDLLFGPGEVIGAGERHATGEQVDLALRHHRVTRADYEWYLAMKDVAPLRTAGFGMGSERFLMWLTDQDDIRDFQIFVRENGRDIVP